MANPSRLWIGVVYKGEKWCFPFISRPRSSPDGKVVSKLSEPLISAPKFISKEFLHLTGEEMAEAVVKITSKGQLTLPAEIRKNLSISEDDYLYITEAGGLILMKKIGVDPREILNTFQQAAKEVGLTRKELNRVIQEIRRAKR